MIAIIDYDAGNIKSVEKALIYLGQDVIVTRNADELLRADKVILPGVGSFGDAMEKLQRYKLIPIIQEIVKNNIPFMGICLGLQLMFEESDESKGIKGLGILPGKICKIPDKEGYKIPHMGWNSIHINPSSRLFHGIKEDSYVYFVHSYYLEAKREEDVAATTDYIVNIHAAVERGNVFATQFHPEKSGTTGLQILKNFAQM